MSIKKAGFSLVELLIVILIISLSYGIIYNNSLKEDNKKALTDFQKIISNIKNHELYKKKPLWVFCNEDKECFVGELLGTKLENSLFFELNENYMTYVLDKYEDLDVLDFENIKVDNFYFRPQIAIKVYKSGVIENNFLNLGDDWFYYSFYENEYTKHISGTQAVYYAKKREYLPHIAGDINDR